MRTERIHTFTADPMQVPTISDRYARVRFYAETFIRNGEDAGYTLSEWAVQKAADERDSSFEREIKASVREMRRNR